MHRRPDIELVVLARKGSDAAAAVLFDRYWTLVWRAAYAVTEDRGLADDAAQEAMEKAFGALHRFDETRPLAPWLRRIAVHRAVDHLRRRRDVPISHEPELDDGTLGVSANDDVRLSAVADAVASLGAGKRAVVVLHYWLDFPLEEVAGILGLPTGTVASRLARAKEELRVALEEEHVL